MSFPRFIVLISLSGLVALGTLLQIFFAGEEQSSNQKLQRTEAALQQGQLCETQLVGIAKRVAQLAQQQQDQSLKDLLTRQGFTIKQPASTPAAPSLSSPSQVPSTSH